jgi:carboxypeptidase Taq
MGEAYGTFIELVKTLDTWNSIGSLLGWDQETYMPVRGAAARAKQQSALAAYVHDRLVSDEMAGALAAVEAQTLTEPQTANVREIRRIHDRSVKVPAALVKEIAETQSLAMGEWAAARKTNVFSKFAPWLDKLLGLKRLVADTVGFEKERYDALLDEFEPGASTAEVAEVFARLRPALVTLVQQIAESKNQPDAELLTRPCPISAQTAFVRQIAGRMGFDFDAGRVDVSTHPFCSGIAAGDVRITTRYDERFLPGALFGTMHETGHGLYEQGFADEHVGTPMAAAVSLGIHESQSRLWENFVGRSRPFWEFAFPQLQASFADAFGDVSLDAWVAAINRVAPSMIRVEADEVTYGLHIILRFELERELLNENIAVKDVPAAWNQRMKDILGVEPSTDAEGCLQDIHWSMGAFGYFPTYSLGNLYAAMFFDAAKIALPNLDDQMRTGDLLPLKTWLNENIHQHGQRYRANELAEKVTGQPLTEKPFVRYLNQKFGALYNL